MTYSDFTRKVAEHMDIPVTDARACADGVFETIIEEIKNTDKIVIKNFGVFKRWVRDAKRRGDINTGKSVVDPPRMMFTFSVSDVLDKTIREMPVD